MDKPANKHSGAKLMDAELGKRHTRSIAMADKHYAMAQAASDSGTNASEGVVRALNNLEQHARMLVFIEHIAGMADRAEKYVDAKALRAVSKLAQDELNFLNNKREVK